jgi:pyruvate formate lyase activating enzyme
MDPQIHRRYTGVSSSRILDNLRRLSTCSVPIEIRMPIIPTVNDTRRHIDAAAELLASLDNITAVRLLPYHRLAGSKYARLDRINTLPDVEPPSPEKLQEIASWIRTHDLHVLMPESV